MRKYIIILTMLFLGAKGAEARHYDRGYGDFGSVVFVEKGKWVVSGSARYSQHVNDDYNFTIISDINSTGYGISANPKAFYMFKDNMGLGLNLSYDRSMLDLTSADLSISDISMNASDCYQISHKYGAHVVYRAYIPLAGSKRIAMFADVMLGGSYKEGKEYNAAGGTSIGSFHQTYAAELAVDPGIVAFLADRLAVELNVGLFGVNYKWTDQIHNQVEEGRFTTSNTGFVVNLLSLGVGLSYYFL